MRAAYRTELDGACDTVLAMKQAACAHASVEEDRLGDPGYYLLGDGRRTFEAAIGFRPPLNTRPGRLSRAFGIGGYVGAGVTVAAVLLAIPLFILHIHSISPVRLSLLGVLGAIPAIDAAVALVNGAVTRGCGATLLAALELRNGVYTHGGTIVARIFSVWLATWIDRANTSRQTLLPAPAITSC